MPLDNMIEVLAEIADEVILPRFRALTDGDIVEKSPGELVTIADREAEVRITAHLNDIMPGVPVIGEEAAETRPSLLSFLHNGETCWLVDPLDGTTNFIAGRPEFAVMIALIRGGETIRSWIWKPVDRIGYAAEKGSGAWRNGQRLHAPIAPADISQLRGAVLTRFLSECERRHVTAVSPLFGDIASGQYCAGFDYPWVAEGKQEFLRFHRLLPWDHAPGILVLTEAGGVARHLDGTPYRADTTRSGLLAASDSECWQRVSAVMTPSS